MSRLTFFPLHRSSQTSREQFKSEVKILDQYLQIQSIKEEKENITRTFILFKDGNIKGFYSIAAGSLEVEGYSERLGFEIDINYPQLPVARVGRLARDVSVKGEGYGEILLMDAFRRILDISRHIGIVAIIVDAKDDKAISFYKRHNFERIDSNKLILSIREVKSLFQRY